MKQYSLLCLLGLMLFASCKKEEDDPGTIYAAPDPNAVVATPPPPGFQFPKTFKESQRLMDFKVWVHGIDVSQKTTPEKVFQYEDWPAGIEIILLNNRQLGVGGSPETYKYFFYKNAMYLIDGVDTFPFPIALGNYSQIELFDYQIKLTSGPSYSSRSVFEKATKATLDEEAKQWGVGDIDTMAYMNSSLILK